MGKIFCFMGKSSTGKDTIYKKIHEDLPDIKEIVLYTTRPIRDGEIDGITYNYVNEKTFNQMFNNNEVIEYRKYNTVHGPWIYYTSSNNIDLDNNNYMIINTLAGYNILKEFYGDSIIPIYIEVEDGIRLERALKREQKETNPKYAELCRRFLADQEDFSNDKLLESEIDKRYINNDLYTCTKEIKIDILNKIDKQKQYYI